MSGSTPIVSDEERAGRARLAAGPLLMAVALPCVGMDPARAAAAVGLDVDLATARELAALAARERPDILAREPRALTELGLDAGLMALARLSAELGVMRAPGIAAALKSIADSVERLRALGGGGSTAISVELVQVDDTQAA